MRKELRRWLRRLHDEIHVTSIFVTHDQEEALEVADEVVLMNQGKVEQVGTPDQVYDHPATPFVYGFLGSVNLFHGRVEGDIVHVGPHQLAHAGTTAGDGSQVVAFVRPHELTISSEASSGGVRAEIERILSIGAFSRVELIGLDEAGMRNAHNYEVEMMRSELNSKQVKQGQEVYLVPRNLKVFGEPDFSI